MARKSVNIDIKFPKKTQVNNQLKELLDSVGKMSDGVKIDFNLDNANKTFKEFSNMLDKIHSQLIKFDTNGKIFKTVNKDTEEAIQQQIKYQKVMGKSLNIGDGVKGFDELKDRAKQIRETVDELAKISFNTSKNGNIKDATITYTDNMGKAVTETMKWKTVATETEGVMKKVFTTTNVNVSENIQTLGKLQEKFQQTKDKMQLKLNTAKGNDLIDIAVINDLQNKLNSINTNTPEKEINELNQAIKNLGSGDSNVVRLQNTISKLQNDMTNLNGKYGSLVGDSSSINQVKAYESQLNKLQSTLNKVKNGTFIDSKKISSEINQTNNSFKTLETSVKNSSHALKLAQKDSASFGSALKDIGTKVGLFSLVYSSINLLKQSFKDGVDSVIGMDKALTDLNKVVDMSKSQLLEMRDVAVSLGKELGRSSIEIANAQAEFGRMFKDSATINELTKTSVMGANVMDGVSSAEVAKGLTTIVTSMKMEAQDSMKILDSMNEIQNNYRVGADDLLSALAEVGSVAYTSGAELEKVQGYITAISVATGEKGSEVGNALRSVMSRIYKIGEEGMEAQGKPEKMLEDIGVAVRDAKGEFRDFPSILDNLNVKWKDMSETEKIATAQTVAGVHRYNQFMSLMNNYQMALDSTSTALNSQGSAYKENEIYMQSAEAKLGVLKTTMEEFMYSLIDSDMLKNGIDSITNILKSLNALQKVFGSLGLSVGVLSGAFLMFTNNPLKSFAQGVVAGEKSLKGLGIGLTTTATKAGVASTGVNILGFSFDVAKIKAVGLQAILTGGISLAITAVIGAVSWLVGELNNSSDSMENCETQARALSDALNDIDGERASIDRYSELNKQLQDANLEEEKKKELQTEQEDIKKRLASSENEYYWILNDSNLSEQEKIDKLNEQYALKLKIKAEELEEEMISQRKAEKKAIELSKVADEYNRLTTAISNADANGNTIYETNDGGFVKYNVQIDGLLERQKQLKDEFADGKNFLDKYNGSVRQLGEAGLETDRAIVDFDGKIKQATSSIKSSTDAINSNTQAKEQNGQIDVGQNMDTNTVSIKTKAMEDSLKSLGMTAEEVKEKIKNIGEDGGLDGLSTEDVTKAYGNATSKITELHKMIESLNQEQSITPQLVTELASKYPEMGSAIFDTVSAQEFLNNKIAEQEDIQAQAYQTMMGDNQQYYSTILANAGEAQSVFDAYASQFVDVNSSAYDFDVKNYRTLNEAKAGLMNSLNPVLSKWLSNLVGGSASQYEKDLSNFTSLAEQKVTKCLVRREICVGHVFNCR